MDKIPLETNDGEFLVRFRDCFSVRYIQSAALLCRLAFAIEQEYQEAEEVPADPLLRHEAFILNSVLSSVAFLESTINELYSDIADNAYFYTDEKNEALLRKIGERWNNEKNFDRAPLLDKYQKILAVADKPLFDHEDPVFSDVRTLIEIRNFLMHYKREWVNLQKDPPSDGPDGTSGEKFETILSNKFAINPLAGRGRPFFPDKCLGHGCAEWAVVNSLSFTDAFFLKLELPAPYDGIKNELLTK